MAEDIVCVWRIIKYRGPRSKVAVQVTNSIHESVDYGNGVLITGTTIGEPVIVMSAPVAPSEEVPTNIEAFMRTKLMKAKR